MIALECRREGYGARAHSRRGGGHDGGGATAMWPVKPSSSMVVRSCRRMARWWC